ncbi:MAG: hypothetical protein IT159_02715 [Bryobacterales bacterium]|jgi:L-alanine-DL-glutamate epimerase-like enolase superfamily enzyme|nr:hypothetical protein [Bryobacterales bacterium]
MALLDIAGKAAKAPVYQVLGGPTRHKACAFAPLSGETDAVLTGFRAIDAGVVLPGVNDGFTGAAPDLGALELGAPEPHYGPGWLTWKPFYR